MSKSKKALQLGMNPSTASHRLVKDILFQFISENHVCYQCGEELTRDTFSIEHKEPWLDSEDPSGLYFDLDNISFSHLTCNIKAGRRRPPMPEEERLERMRTQHRRDYTPEKRRAQYLRTGK